MNSSYTSLEPASLKALGVEAPTFDGGSTSFFATTSFLYTLFFVLIIGASFYRYLVAGILRMQASESSIRQSNDVIKKATLGLLGVFSLFLILVTLNKNLVTGDVGLDIVRDTSVPKAAPIAVPAPGVSNYAARKASHDAVETRLAPSNIHTNHQDTACTEAQFNEARPSCTSLSFLPEESIQMLLKINGDCKNNFPGCLVIISGGTEPGHTSHGERLRPFDLRINGSQSTTDPLYLYIKAIGTPGSMSGCYITYKYAPFTFCDEKPPNPSFPTWAPHFHVF